MIIYLLFGSVVSQAFNVSLENVENNQVFLTRSALYIKDLVYQDFNFDSENLVKEIKNRDAKLLVVSFHNDEHEFKSFLDLTRDRENLKDLSVEVHVSSNNEIVNIFLIKNELSQTKVKIIRTTTSSAQQS